MKHKPRFHNIIHTQKNAINETWNTYYVSLNWIIEELKIRKLNWVLVWLWDWEEEELESPIWGWAEKAWSQAVTSILLNQMSVAAVTACSSEANGDAKAISFANLVLPQHARKSFSSYPISISLRLCVFSGSRFSSCCVGLSWQILDE